MFVITMDVYSYMSIIILAVCFHHVFTVPVELQIQLEATVAANCRDEQIWIADGSVECRYLETPSHWGVHDRPEYFCNRYPLTDCCQTCTRLRDTGVVA